MAKKSKNSEIKTVLRMPGPLHKRLKKACEQNRRSMNSEILLIIEGHLEKELV